jgi:delta1-piperideine-2-carboxylate reductase
MVILFSRKWYLVVDPRRANLEFGERVNTLLAALVEAGTERLPGDRRYQHRRRALAEGVRITRAEHDALLALANGDVRAR